MKTKCLLYCTKAKPQLVKHNNGYNLNNLPKCNWELKEYEEVELNGKIVCECEVETEEIIYALNPTPFDRANFFPREWPYDYQGKYYLTHEEVLKRSCLTDNELSDYLNTPTNDKKRFCDDTFGYALYLSNVKERVMELSKCHKLIKVDDADFNENDYKYVPIEKAPQNMMWVWVFENGKWVKYLLISVRPQWLCKILNKQKDIEVRRKVLKGMVD